MNFALAFVFAIICLSGLAGQAFSQEVEKCAVTDRSLRNAKYHIGQLFPKGENGPDAPMTVNISVKPDKINATDLLRVVKHVRQTFCKENDLLIGIFTHKRIAESFDISNSIQHNHFRGQYVLDSKKGEEYLEFERVPDYKVNFSNTTRIDLKKEVAVCPMGYLTEKKPTKQRHFDVEEDFDSPVPLPSEAWKLIVEAEENSHIKDQLLEDDDPAHWVLASKIDIDLNGYDDYIAMGRKIPLLGPNVARFYIIMNSGGDKYEIALNAPAKALFISDKRDRHGARKLETLTMTAFEFFGSSYFFDGKQFQFKKMVRSKIS